MKKDKIDLLWPYIERAIRADRRMTTDRQRDIVVSATLSELRKGNEGVSRRCLIEAFALAAKDASANTTPSFHDEASMREDSVPNTGTGNEAKEAQDDAG